MEYITKWAPAHAVLTKEAAALWKAANKDDMGAAREVNAQFVRVLGGPGGPGPDARAAPLLPNPVACLLAPRPGAPPPLQYEDAVRAVEDGDGERLDIKDYMRLSLALLMDVQLYSSDSEGLRFAFERYWLNRGMALCILQSALLHERTHGGRVAL